MEIGQISPHSLHCLDALHWSPFLRFLAQIFCALLFILRTIGITVFLHGRSHTYVVSMMGLPLGANGILTIPYINLASQNLNAAFFSFQKKFCWVSLTSNHDKLSAFIICIPEFSFGVIWGDIAKRHCNVGFTIAIFRVFWFLCKINRPLPLFIIVLTSLSTASFWLQKYSLQKILFAKNSDFTHHRSHTSSFWLVARTSSNLASNLLQLQYNL